MARVNGVGGRAVISHSPLANPATPIYALASTVQEYLYFPDPGPLYALVGAVAANKLQGNPVWLMLIGPPSCGGTELLKTLMGLPGVFEVDEISNESALLSGTSKKERAADSTGGVLRQIGKRGDIIIPDFTLMLSMEERELKRLLGNFRRIYDGSWTRTIGGEGGRVMCWEGKVGVYSKCTQEIDRHHRISSSMGERWVYYRYPESTGFGEARAALLKQNEPGWQDQLRDHVKSFFDGLDIQSADARKPTDTEIFRTIAAASFAAKCRATVSRDYSKRDIEDVPDPEYPTRLATVLQQLYLGMERIGLYQGDCWRIAGKIAMDCMPYSRSRMIRMISRSQLGFVGFDELQRELRVSMTVVRRIVDDLQAHGVVIKDKQVSAGIGNGKLGVRLSEWSLDEMNKGGLK